MLELRMGNVVRLKKAHPCGSFEWEVVRLGADIGLRCLRCDRRTLNRQVGAGKAREGSRRNCSKVDLNWCLAR